MAIWKSLPMGNPFRFIQEGERGPLVYYHQLVSRYVAQQVGRRSVDGDVDFWGCEYIRFLLKSQGRRGMKK